MFTINNKGTRTTPFTTLTSNIVNIDILIIKCLLLHILVLKLLTGNSLLGRVISQTKTFKIKSFLPFNFSITKICVAIRLAEMEH